MRLTVLGGTGGWPAAAAACSGYLAEHDGHRVLIDPGYATFPRLLEHCAATAVDAVLVSHGHPDHCADLSPLLRARAWAERPAPPLPHTRVNAGLRLAAGGAVLAYTGDTGPSPDLPVLARDADLFVADASYPEQVPADLVRYLSSARQAGQVAAAAEARGLLLTHLMPGTDPGAAVSAACAGYDGNVAVAIPGLTRMLPP